MDTLLAVAAAPVWPATNGIALRQAALLPLLRSGWRVVLASPGPEGEVDPAAIDEHVEIPRLSRWNPSPGRAERGAVQGAVAPLVDLLRPSAILLWVGAEHIAFSHPRWPRIVSDSIDAMTLSAWRDIRARRTGFRRHEFTTLSSFAAYERQVVRSASATAVVGEDDARVLRWLSGRPSVHVVGNGVVPTSHFRAHRNEGPPTVTFTGVMNFPPNVEAVLHFAREVWPRVRSRRPEARFVVAGRQPVAAILALDKGGRDRSPGRCAIGGGGAAGVMDRGGANAERHGSEEQGARGLGRGTAGDHDAHGGQWARGERSQPHVGGE